MEGKEILTVVLTLVMMIAIFVGAYFFTRYYGKHYRTRYGTTKNLSILESQAVGKDGALLIVKAADRIFLVGTTPHAFTLLSELDPNTLETSAQAQEAPPSFSSAFKTALKNFGKKQDEGEHR